MAINIKFDLNGNPELPTIILTERNGDRLGQLYVNADSVDMSGKMNSASEISFTLNKYIDGKRNYLWDKVLNFKLIYCKEWDMYFEIRVELDEETETIKTVFCKQLGQAELSQIMLYGVEINTENDVARTDYKPSVLYNVDDPSSSILNRILSKAPHYSIVHVDYTIANIQRSFSFNEKSIVDAFSEIGKEIGCLFVYHSNSDENGNIQRTISVYDLQQKCVNVNCGYRGEFTNVCPKCGKSDIKYGYGNDTSIFVTADELASGGIQFVTDTDSVKNCFKLEAGDELMTATIRNCNPNGTDFIWYFSNDLKSNMPKQLVKKIEEYDILYDNYYKNYESNINIDSLRNYNNLVEKYSEFNYDLQKIATPIKGYSNLMNAYYNAIDMYLFLESSLMPSVEMENTSAEQQSEYLISNYISPVAVLSADSISLSTINNAVLTMIKTIVKSTYKVKVKTADLFDNGKEKIWKGNFTITSYANEEDTVTTKVISVIINNDKELYIKQKISKALSENNTDDYSVSGLFHKEYNDFCAELKKYALIPLNAFRDACQACIDIFIEQGITGDFYDENLNNEEYDKLISENMALYEKLYLPYFNKLLAIDAEIKIRENEINVIKGVYNSENELITDGLITYIEKYKKTIQDALDFEAYLGHNLWMEFCSYRREDKYLNDNYISDGLNNAELFEKALEFIEVAENEIYKSSELQHSISTSLKNLLAIPKFKCLTDSFETGNWILVQIDDSMYKLRLLEYNINFGDFDNISVEFSDVMKIKNGFTDLEDVFEQATSMATSYDSVKKQAKQGNEAKGTILQWLNNGLNSALIKIQNNNSEEVTITKSGILARSYNDITDSYSSEQLKITHNILAYTTDDWKSVKQAIGKHDYVAYDLKSDIWGTKTGYGMSADFVTAGQIMGSRIVGGEIFSANYRKGISGSPRGTYIDLINGNLSFGNGKIIYDSNTNVMTLSGVEIKWGDTNAPTISDIGELEEYLDDIENQVDKKARSWYQDTDPSLTWDKLEDHTGDLWYNSSSNSQETFIYENGAWKKTNVPKELFDTIDGIASIYVTIPENPVVGDLLIPTKDIGIYKAGKVYKYNGSSWIEIGYTDDTKANEAYGLADKAKGIADNALTLGETLSKGLGFKTQINDTYVISPVIAGGTLLIGDKTGTYAQITTDGKLICTNADVSGSITTSTFVGGSIYSTNYVKNSIGTYIGLDDGYFEVGGGTLTYDNNVLTLGKQNETSIINLCGGLGTIKYTNLKSSEIGGHNTSGLQISNENTINPDILLRTLGNGTGKIYLYAGNNNSESQGQYGMIRCTNSANIDLVAKNWSVDGSFKWSSIGLTWEYIDIDSNANLYLKAGNEVQLQNKNTSILFQPYDSSDSYNAFFKPSEDGKVTLGTSQNKWNVVYAANSTIQTSDRREKENIISLDTSELFDKLKPVQYNFIKGNKKKCYGLIAQDVIESLKELGIDENELDLVHHDRFPNDDTGEEEDTYGIAYTNLIAMLIYEVQKLKEKIKQ